MICWKPTEHATFSNTAIERLLLPADYNFGGGKRASQLKISVRKNYRHPQGTDSRDSAEQCRSKGQRPEIIAEGRAAD